VIRKRAASGVRKSEIMPGTLKRSPATGDRRMRVR
jgi:hypothetical protein